MPLIRERAVLPVVPATARRFAFLVHPRGEVANDAGRLLWSPLARLPDATVERAMRRLPIPALVTGGLVHGRKTLGEILAVPLSARQFLRLPRPEVQARITGAVDRARDRGAEIVGLGALTSPLTAGGRLFADRSDVAVTNGNAFTAAMTVQGIERILGWLGPTARVAVVGASGSVGSCLVGLLARRRSCSNLVLLGRRAASLEAVQDAARVEGLAADVSTDLATLRDADLVVLLTSSADAVLQPEHLKRGAWVLDDTQPRNTSPMMREVRPDVTVVDGGLVSLTGIRVDGYIGLPESNLAFACLAETILLALDGRRGHFSLGNPTADQVEEILVLAERYRAFGFGLAPLRSFGAEITLPMSGEVRQCPGA